MDSSSALTGWAFCLAQASDCDNGKVMPAPDPKHCDEKSRLAWEFASAAASYSRAANALRAAIHGDTTDILDEIKRTRDESRRALRALRSHIAKHQCSGKR